MHTVNFTCGHCRKLMAVSSEWLGKRVRCPHCQQVVQTPSAPPVEDPGIPQIQSDDVESIFAAGSASEDALDGPLPRVELPPEESPRSPVASEEDLELTVAAGPSPIVVDFPPESPWSSSAPQDPVDTSTVDAPLPLEEEPELSLGPSPGAKASSRSRWGGLITALVIVPLISYSILATIAIIILKSQPAPPHPLEILPDLEGDRPGATQGKKGHTLRYRVASPDLTPMPSQLRVSLGDTLAIGDLEVTPQKVQRRTITYRHGPQGRPERATNPSLALVLRLKNRSEQVTFCPMDRFFTRRYNAEAPGGSAMPFTILEASKRRKFYGGPSPWPGPELIEGQNYDRELPPGEEMTTFVCTAPEDLAVDRLEPGEGPLLWRVQVRRGLVRWRTARGQDREDSATAVIGVEFTGADVIDADPAE